ncbi:MAG: multiprotein bridging factor aMBF1 [Thermoplasmata archaeon]
MYCEMCGKNVPKTQRVLVEGTVLMLCDSCAKFGKILDPPKTEVRPVIIERPQSRPVTAYVPRQKKPPVRKSADQEDLFIAPEYAQIIREAREKLAWTQEDLAAKLLEKKNVLAKVERGELQPDMKLARKIEKLLDIKIIEKY